MKSRDTNTRDNDAYLEVLCNIIGLESPVERCGYFEVMHQLYDTEFLWSVPNDDNRALDGLRLREKHNITFTTNQQCNVLEMLVALACRCEDDMMYDPDEGDRSADWFWMMMTNLGLNKFRDFSFGNAWNCDDVTFITDRFMDREYYTNGTGGLFPLKQPNKDQTEVEIWYQMCAYLMENFNLG